MNIQKQKIYGVVSYKANVQGSHGPIYNESSIRYLLDTTGSKVILFTLGNHKSHLHIDSEYLQIKTYSFITSDISWLTSSRNPILIMFSNIREFFLCQMFASFVMRELKKLDVDVLHISDLEAVSASRLVRWYRHNFPKNKIGYVCHNPNFTSLRTNMRTTYKTLTSSYMRRLINDVNFIFVHGSWSQHTLIEQLRLNPYQKSKVHVAHYGSEEPVLSNLTQTECQIMLGLNIPTGSPVVLFFGSTRKDKNPILFLDIIEKVPNLHGIIAGKSSDYSSDELKMKAVSSGYNHRLHIIDNHIPEHHLKLLFGSTNLLLSTHSDPTVNSGPVQISRTYGVPVIGPNVGEIGSYIKTHGVGQTVSDLSVISYANAIQQYLNMSINEKDLLREHIYSIGRKFTWNHMASVWVEKYNT